MENLFHSKSDLALLTQPHMSPCLSLYVPLARGGNHKEDTLRLEQLTRQAEIMLTSEGLSREEVSELVQPIEGIVQDGIRNLQGEKIVGMAFFVAPDMQKTYSASHSPPEMVTVDRHFDLRPLVDLLPLEDEFYILAISRDQFILYQSSQESLTPVALPNGASIQLEYPIFSPNREHQFTSEYFRLVCQNTDLCLTDKKVPLIIASTEALHPVVKQQLKYPYVANEGIHMPTAPDKSNPAALLEPARKVLESYHQEKKREQLARYREIAGTRYSASTAADIMQAALNGQIEVLLASSRRNLYGRYDPTTGDVAPHQDRQPADTELVSLAVQQAINHGARVYLVDDSELPQDCPMVAILRW